MTKHFIKVPRGIQFISNWKDYVIPKNCHCIVDKGVTGCGYTEYCLTNNENIVLVSPRKTLMENKIAQHEKDKNIFYAENNVVDNESRRQYLDGIYSHIDRCLFEELPCKIMVSYDSLHYVVEVINGLNLNSSFQYIIDEFQSIFLDSFFKADVELDFVETLQKCRNVVYLSATPMLDKYLEKLDQFNSLDFYKLDWSGTGFVETVHINRKKVSSLTAECGKIILNYMSGNFPITLDSNNNVIESREAVFYLNSVTDITRIINKYGLTSKTTGIICSNTPDNIKKLKKVGFEVGKVPLKGEENPMFMFCTSTSYIGVDFYSKCASSYVFADPNLKHLALDISLDLPQIIGRQRDKSNPFKNDITVYYKTPRNQEEKLSREGFLQRQSYRKQLTDAIITEFDKMTEIGKTAYLMKIRESIAYSKYCNDFVSISKETGLPVYNPLIEISNERAWEVAQEDYQDSLTVTKTISDLGYKISEGEDKLDHVVDFLQNNFYSTGIFKKKLRAYCEFRDLYKHDEVTLDRLDRCLTDKKFSKYYEFYGTAGCRKLKFEEKNLIEGLKTKRLESPLESKIYESFEIGKKYSMVEIKTMLGDILKELNITTIKPKSTLLLDYFEMSRTKFVVGEQIVNGFKLIKIKR